MRAAFVYKCIEKREGVGIDLTRRPLFTNKKLR